MPVPPHAAPLASPVKSPSDVLVIIGAVVKLWCSPADGLKSQRPNDLNWVFTICCPIPALTKSLVESTVTKAFPLESYITVFVVVSAEGWTLRFLLDKYKDVASPSPQVICFIVVDIPLFELFVCRMSL